MRLQEYGCSPAELLLRAPARGWGGVNTSYAVVEQHASRVDVQSSLCLHPSRTPESDTGTGPGCGISSLGVLSLTECPAAPPGRCTARSSRASTQAACCGAHCSGSGWRTASRRLRRASAPPTPRGSALLHAATLTVSPGLHSMFTGRFWHQQHRVLGRRAGEGGI